MSAVVKPRLPAGIELGVSFDAYNASPGIRASALTRLRRSPLHYAHAIAHWDESTAPMRLGTAAHCAVLEPDCFRAEYVAWSRITDSGNMAPRRGQYWEAFQAENKGKSIVTVDEMNAAGDIAAAIHGDPLAMTYLVEGWPEVTLRGTVSAKVADGHAVERRAKCRPDWLTIDGDRHYLVGLKTARDAGPESFPRAAERLGYHIAWAWYHDLYKRLTGIAPQMIEVVVESAPPHDVVVYEIAEDTLDAGRNGTDRDEGYRELLRQLIDCEQRQHFPGAGRGQLQTFMLPSAAYGDSLGWGEEEE